LSFELTFSLKFSHTPYTNHTILYGPPISLQLAIWSCLVIVGVMERTGRTRRKGRTSWWYGNRAIDPVNGKKEIPYHLDNISQLHKLNFPTALDL
jgi:hypothetical protein